MDMIRGLLSPTNGTFTQSTVGPDPDRVGSFIVPDVYPDDLGASPPFHVLPGLKASGHEVVGCYVKCSEGVGWGATNEQWFRRAWRELRRVGGDRYGTDWFRGCYHFLRFQEDGARQADYLLDLIESAGGWGPGDLVPWVDIEEMGQGSWAGGKRLEDITDRSTRTRLANEVTRCAGDFVARVKQRHPGMRVGVYGRGLFRDLGMSACRFGGDLAVNPAYIATMPPMDAYGWPTGDVGFWQLTGDGVVHAQGFPTDLPGWGATDYSVYVNGSLRTSLTDLRQRTLAFPR
jgi:GH25 family lysozyme M1 (1,4-beta-N-acetylmuramidase)